MDRRSHHRSDNARLRNGIAVGIAALMAMVMVFGSVSISRYDSANPSTSEPTVREFTLTAEQIEWELQPGTTVTAWAYNGQIPGPTIRVDEGDLVKITLVNHLPTGTTLHSHGLQVPPEMDGPAGLNQEPIEPGGSFTYEFVAKPAGTRWYHSHTDVSTQVALGLYGAFIVDPRDGGHTYDRDYTYVLSEWDADLTPNVALGIDPPSERDAALRGGEWGADWFLMNGKVHEAIPPIVVTEGDEVLIRLINAGSMVHPFHTHGHSFRIVATDGNPVPEGAQLTKDTVLVAPGERYDIVFQADNPGVWMVHCHIENHAENGMMTTIQYEGELPSGPARENWNPDEQEVPSLDGGSGADLHAVLGHGASPTVATAAPAGESGAFVVLTDNRFRPISLTVEAGTTVTFVNRGRNTHSVLADDGSFESPDIPSGTSYALTFSEPGTYTVHCRQHVMSGMRMTVVVE